MKNKKLRRLPFVYALRGAVFGLIIALVMCLFAADSDAFHDSERTMSDYIDAFPAFWLVVLLPFATALAAYFLSHEMVVTIRDMKKALKDHEKDSEKSQKYVEHLASGDLEVDLGIDERKDDLSVSLKKLKYKLKDDAAEENKRREEENNRTWVTNGIAQFGETLRRNNDDMSVLSYNIIRFLVDYVHLNQAGFFYLHNGEEKGDAGRQHFELTAFIAYDRKKYAQKEVEWGEGLVGRCGQEQKTIYITDLPKNYINVTSGLGDGAPRALLLVPLKTNDKIYGVIEMATLEDRFQDHQIELIEKMAESIAMTIATVQTNMQTSKLLAETQAQADKMRAQEEIMHQNMEEMKATEEESAMNAIKMQGFIDAINHASISCHFDSEGYISEVNDNFLKTFGYKREEVMGQNMSIFFFKDSEEEYNTVLDSLRQGNTFNGRVRRRSKRGEEIWLLSTYTPVTDNGEVREIITLESNIKDQVELENEMKKSQEVLDMKLRETREEVMNKFKEIEAVKVRNEMMLDGMLDAIVTTSDDGTIEFFNKAAESLWGYDRSEVLNQSVTMLFSEETVASAPFVTAYVTPGAKKIVGDRKEISIKNKFGEEVSVLALLSEAEVGEDHSYTAFIQNVEVELF